MALEQEFYRAMAHRVRELAGRADPFIRRRLLALAERYEAKDGKPAPLSRSPSVRCRRCASSRRPRQYPCLARPEGPPRPWRLERVCHLARRRP